MALSKIFTGARAKFFVQLADGTTMPMAYGSGVSGDESIDLEAVEVLDNLRILEHVPVGYRCSLNCQLFRTIVGTGHTSPVVTGTIEGRMGSLKQRGIMPLFEDILTTGAMTSYVLDSGAGKGTGIKVYTYHGVRTAASSFDITPRGIVGENVTFVATYRTDESKESTVS